MSDLCPRCRTWCEGDCGYRGYDAPRRPAAPRASVTVRASAGRLHVSSPYDATFVSTVKCLGGKWSAQDRVWVVPAKQRDALRDLLVRCYQTDGGLPPPAGAAAASAAPPAPSAPPVPVPRTPRDVLAAAMAALPQVEQMIVPAGGA